MKKMLTKQYQRFSHALRGIKAAIISDKSFQSQFFGGIVILCIYYFIFRPFTQMEILFLGLAWTLILITELQNSSFEEALDRMHPEHHESIGKSKDEAAGAVLLAGFFMLLVMIVIAIT